MVPNREACLTPTLRTLTTEPDALRWAAELARDPTAVSSIYLLDSGPIYAAKVAGRWEFWRDTETKEKA